jgi:hypothetical protein
MYPFRQQPAGISDGGTVYLRGMDGGVDSKLGTAASARGGLRRLEVEDGGG